MTDEYLMLCIKNDDLDKVAILYERYTKKLYLYFLSKNKHDSESSEDCVQQVFYRLIKYRKTFKDDSNFGMWIYGIARNVQFKDFNTRNKISNAYADYQVAETYDQVNDDNQALNQAMQLLPDQYREVLIMTKYLGLKYEEIAAINNCSVGAIKNRVYRAIQNLRDIYFKIS